MSPQVRRPLMSPSKPAATMRSAVATSNSIRKACRAVRVKSGRVQTCSSASRRTAAAQQGAAPSRRASGPRSTAEGRSGGTASAPAVAAANEIASARSVGTSTEIPGAAGAANSLSSRIQKRSGIRRSSAAANCAKPGSRSSRRWPRPS